MCNEKEKNKHWKYKKCTNQMQSLIDVMNITNPKMVFETKRGKFTFYRRRSRDDWWCHSVLKDSVFLLRGTRYIVITNTTKEWNKYETVNVCKTARFREKKNIDFDVPESVMLAKTDLCYVEKEISYAIYTFILKYRHT